MKTAMKNAMMTPAISLPQSSPKFAFSALLLGVALIALPQAGLSQAAVTTLERRTLSAAVADSDGASLGHVEMSDTASGAVEVKLDFDGLSEGTHAVHIHETGVCRAPDFKSAGGHLTGGKDHGAYTANGMHSGDLPNIVVGSDGAAEVTYFSQNITLDQVMDDDGSAFVIHSGADDYMSQPSGDAGSRIACGVFETAND